MNLQQLEYILAVDTFRHFARAAEHCHITQPTLSMMIQKLEEELGVKIFDRTKQPVCPTDVGIHLIEQAREVLTAAGRFKAIAAEIGETVFGELKVGIIPTIAPYLLPIFIDSFHAKYPDVRLKISEVVTSQLLERLDTGDLDVGIMVAPENEKGLVSIDLYHEPFVVYTPQKYNKQYLLAEDLNVNELLLLEEGHCFRSQIIQFCELRDLANRKVEFTSGSLETLRYLTEQHMGVTVLPELATRYLPADKMAFVKQFAEPRPSRQVSLVSKRAFVKKKLIEAFVEEILLNVPSKIAKGDMVNVPLNT